MIWTNLIVPLLTAAFFSSFISIFGTVATVFAAMLVISIPLSKAEMNILKRAPTGELLTKEMILAELAKTHPKLLWYRTYAVPLIIGTAFVYFVIFTSILFVTGMLFF